MSPLRPITGIYTAVTRRTIDSKNPNGWVPEQKVTAAQAVRAYTVNAAYAEGEEKIKGSIAPGMLADLVILSQDMFRIDPVYIDSTEVDMTTFDGRVLYERKPTVSQTESSR